MHVVGVIAEYNPFHQGHAYQLRAIRERFLDDVAIVAVMSGSFTQRGEAAVLDKWRRADLAVCGGCQLVLELPFLFACRSAQDFARGGVRLLQGLGCVDTLAFGAESPDLAPLMEAAHAIDAPETQAALHEALRAGASYAKALTAILQEASGLAANLLRQPNNILAIEYLRALRGYAPGIEPLLIVRRGAGYHEASLGPLASASAIRGELAKAQPDFASLKDSLPEATYAAIRAAFPVEIASTERLFRPLLARLLTMQGRELEAIFGLQEGLANRLLAKSRQSQTLQELIAGMVTSRYPASRISRIVPHLLLGTGERAAREAAETGPLYARVLAFDEVGRELLHTIKERSALPLITKVSAALNSRERLEGDLTPLQAMLALDTRATELRALALPDHAPLAALHQTDFITSPHFIRSTHHA
ncbi:tRNA(Met) cytidine acetate ligase [Mitsuokella multacida]|uniref:tRNA(Met) cytidine acetate ligase n=1 Tax=Mitsuokella multacida TaxID=52226 RepID=UPI00241D6F41|nr:nucleotidyltransferase family protein [Mitsuokella multacida]